MEVGCLLGSSKSGIPTCVRGRQKRVRGIDLRGARIARGRGAAPARKSTPETKTLAHACTHSRTHWIGKDRLEQLLHPLSLPPQVFLASTAQESSSDLALDSIVASIAAQPAAAASSTAQHSAAQLAMVLRLATAVGK
ncbi:hypothetical protein C0Q70_08146 [Pomacea canaliculata]|uniref:Uncharacterized protein n=1 Tax=Pomacea canaliculata TaxID=400727 RepID=A0A2T7PH06_POMCA|nr:hypothetical protein C0Q70_08146 [Pomacea canaliculata]